MDRESATNLIDRLHEAQGELYSGGAGGALEQLLTPDVIWTVPGTSSIAGTYRGRDEVLAYMRRRRDLAAGSFRMTRRDVLTGAGNRVAALTDGLARIGGLDLRWSTVGLYEIIDGQIAACWLLPLDQTQFDRIWSQRAEPGLRGK